VKRKILLEKNSTLCIFKHMDNKQRVELIRAGNELFNNGNIEKATEIFIKTGYRDGLTRVADYHFYDMKQPLTALKFYQMVKSENMVNQIYDRMFFALGKLLGNEQEQKVELPPLKVSPKLKILAEEILRRENESESSNKQ
jgi:hypothetical protein